MKHLILVAAFTLVAAPAFAGGGADAHHGQKARTFTTTQIGSAARDSARAQRDDKLRNAAQNRSENARAAVRGLPRYY